MTSLILALAIAAPGPKDPAKPPPMDHPLIGEWVVDSHVSSGKPIGRRDKPERVTITQDRWKVFVEIGAESCLTIDTKKNPPHIDVWVPTQGDEEPSRASGIYKLEGDTLTVCYRLDAVRPTKFESTIKSGDYLLTLKRSKKQ